MTILSLLQSVPTPPVPAVESEGLAFNEVVREYIKFAGYFLAIGASAYRYLILPRFDRSEEGAVFGMRTAAIFGVAGVFLLLLSLLGGIEINAILHDKTFVQSMPKAIGRFRFQALAMATSLVGYTLARRASPRFGWPLAAIAILGVVLQPLVTARSLSGRVNAVHILAASTWLGTLTVMLFAGIRALLRAPAAGTSRGTAAAGIVNAFTPVALTAATVVALTGLTTAWLHLKRLPNLWETGYGKALLVKLALVIAVVSMGWWNWKRVKPSLAGADESIHRLNRSATTEVIFSALVLAATAVLVSLPSPK